MDKLLLLTLEEEETEEEESCGCLGDVDESVK